MHGLTVRRSYIVFYPSEMEGHVVLTFQFFSLSVISPVTNKASHQCDLSLCHSNAYRKIIKENDFSSLFRWNQGGIPLSPLISPSNPSVYMGTLLSPDRENHILMRSILG